MKTKKDRRHSGRVFPRCNVPQKVLDEEGIVVEEFWDDWTDHRDGLRAMRPDPKMQRKEKIKSKALRRSKSRIFWGKRE